MRRIVFWIVPLLVLGPALLADDKDKAKDDKTPAAGEKTAADQYQALMKEVQKAQNDLRKKYAEAKNDEEREKIVEQFRNLPKEFVGKFLELAEKHPKEKAAFDALNYVVANAPAGAVGDKAADLLLKDHADQLNGRVIQTLVNSNSPAVEKVLRGVVARETDPKAKGQATLNLAQYLKKQSEAPNRKFAEAKKLNKQAEDLLVKVTDKYADVGTLADQAKKALEDVRHGIGREVPEIEGEDVDGKKFKLSDYRGKVVLLDFWGHW